jgi:hypothetical protein
MIGLATLAIAVPGGMTLAAKADKVDVCHIAGNGNVQVISVSGNAVAAHQAHGDALYVDGECQSEGDSDG